jgi:hypothetical protein
MVNLLELFHERAAIREHEGKQSRATAEWETYQEMRRIYGKANLPAEIKKILPVFTKASLHQERLFY